MNAETKSFVCASMVSIVFGLLGFIFISGQFGGFVLLCGSVSALIFCLIAKLGNYLKAWD